MLDAMPSTNLKPEEEDAVLDQSRVYRTTYMFSATMPSAVERLARKYLRRPVVVNIGSAGKATDNVTQRVVVVKVCPTFIQVPSQGSPVPLASSVRQIMWQLGPLRLAWAPDAGLMRQIGWFKPWTSHSLLCSCCERHFDLSKLPPHRCSPSQCRASRHCLPACMLSELGCERS